MKLFSKKEFRALVLLLVAVLILEFFFGSISVRLKTAYTNIATRQVAAIGDPNAKCSSSVAGIPSLADVSVIHSICNPPGPPPKGRDGWACAYTGAGLGPTDLPKGHTVAGKCSIGCCTAMTYTAPSAAINNFGSKFFSTLGNSLVTSVVTGTVSQLVGSLFSGAGGSSSSGGTGIEFRNPGDEDSYLQFSSDTELGADADLGALNLAFGDSTTNTNNNDDTTTLAYGTGGSEQQGGTAQSSAVQQRAERGDSVETRYESLRTTTNARGSGGVAPLPGDSEFDQDFFGSSFNSRSDDEVYRGGLTLAELELQAQELQRQQYTAEGQVNNTGGLEDFRSSNIARSNDSVEGNPLSNSRYDNLDYERLEDELTWWQKLIELIGKLLGAN